VSWWVGESLGAEVVCWILTLLLLLLLSPPAGQPLTDSEKECLRSYFYHIAAARGSGEFALRHLLAPGAWAHSPLQERLQELKVGGGLLWNFVENFVETFVETFVGGGSS
jgi:hypothetical protein